MRRAALTAGVVVVWITLVVGVYEWSVRGSGWEGANTAFAALFGLAAAVPVLAMIWRRPPD